MPLKILFLGDSLGLPRADRKVIDIQTWPHLVSETLSNSKFQFFYQFSGGAHSGKLLAMRKDGYLTGYDPDIVVLQVGIVDCASRALREGTRNFISTIPLVRRVVRKIVNRFHGQLLSLRNISYVSRGKFKFNLSELKGEFPSSEFIVIPIAPACDEYCKLMPRIRKNITDYNKILEEVFTISLLGEVYSGNPVEDLVLDDFHHLSKLGHRVVAKSVAVEVRNVARNLD